MFFCVTFHTSIKFEPNPKILGTQKWPKTADFWIFGVYDVQTLHEPLEIATKYLFALHYIRQ